MKFSKIKEVKSPSRGTSESAGIDFYIPEKAFHHGFKTLKPGESVLIPSGIKVKFSSDYALVAFNKSGIAVKKGLSVGASVVDSDYQGEVHLHLINTSKESQIIMNGEKIMQFLLLPVRLCNLSEVPEEILFDQMTLRGEGGFGSTGSK